MFLHHVPVCGIVKSPVFKNLFGAVSNSPTPQLPKCAGVPGSWGVGNLQSCRVAKLRKNGDWRKCQDGCAKWGMGLLRAVLELQVPNSPTPQVRRRAGELGSWGLAELQSCKVEKKCGLAKMSGWVCEMVSGFVTGCFGTPSPQLPNSPSAQAYRGVGELGTWPILTFQFPKCADARGVGELGSWLGCQRAVWSRASFGVGSFWNGKLRGRAMAAFCGKWMAVE